MIFAWPFRDYFIQFQVTNSRVLLISFQPSSWLIDLARSSHLYIPWLPYSCTVWEIKADSLSLAHLSIFPIDFHNLAWVFDSRGEVEAGGAWVCVGTFDGDRRWFTIEVHGFSAGISCRKRRVSRERGDTWGKVGKKSEPGKMLKLILLCDGQMGASETLASNVGCEWSFSRPRARVSLPPRAKP